MRTVLRRPFSMLDARTRAAESQVTQNWRSLVVAGALAAIPVPLFAASGLAIPLPAFVYRIAVELAEASQGAFEQLPGLRLETTAAAALREGSIRTVMGESPLAVDVARISEPERGGVTSASDDADTTGGGSQPGSSPPGRDTPSGASPAPVGEPSPESPGSSAPAPVDPGPRNPIDGGSNDTPPAASAPPPPPPADPPTGTTPPPGALPPVPPAEEVLPPPPVEPPPVELPPVEPPLVENPIPLPPPPPLPEAPVEEPVVEEPVLPEPPPAPLPEDTPTLPVDDAPDLGLL